MRLTSKAVLIGLILGPMALGACGGSSSSTSKHASNSTTTSNNWPPAERTAFMNACNRTSGGQVAYCTCALNKISAEIPANQTSGVTPQDPRVQRAIQSCLNGGGAPVKNGWPALERNAFMNSCNKSSGGQTAYCSCALDKVSATVPATKAGSVTINDPRVQKAIRDCLPRVKAKTQH